MSEYAVPFNRPFIVGKELYYIAQAVHRGHLAGNGPFSQRCAQWMQERYGARRVLLTHSGTAAIEMAALLCGIGAGDEVILPAFTFVSTANAFMLRQAKPVFVDVRPDTLNLDEYKIEAAITDKTRAICPVHYAGVGCEMDAILKIAQRRSLKVIEDAAQAVDAKYKDKYLGTLGDFGCYSFHETKNFISGEGGALVVNHEADVERAEIVREKGTNRTQFLRGEVDKYVWVDIGSSYLPSEIVAAFLYAQLEESEAITHKRWALFDEYMAGLAPLEQAGLLRLPRVPETCRHNAHMFYILLNDADTRGRLIAFLKARGIQAVFHYVPLHTAPMGLQLGYRPGDLPVTEDISARLLRLPCFFELEHDDQVRVIEGITAFLKG